MTLTPRETEVLRMIGYGMTARQIAAWLGRSIRTIEAHVFNARSKLGAHTLAHAAVLFAKGEVA